MLRQLTAVLALILLCVATPVVVRENHIKLPVTRRFNFDPTTGSTLLDKDRARVHSLKSRVRSPSSDKTTAGSPQSIAVTNIADAYTAEVQVGSPPRTFNLLIDTGSSNTFVGTDPSNRFKASSTTKETGEILLIEFGSGEVLGREVNDQLTFGGMTIPTQGLGAILASEGFDGVDGILGIGPTDLTEGTTIGGGTIPTVTDNAFTLGLIPNKQVGIAFEPTTASSVTNGQLTFGGIDTSKFTGTLHTVSITTTSPASEFVGVDQTVSYGDTVILAQTSGIVDTGTTLIMLATDAFDAYQAATGAVADQTTGLLSITPAQFSNLQSLFFNIGGVDFEITPNAQLWPRSLNTLIGGSADGIFLIVGDLGTASGEGLDFINGFGFLERFFVVFDSGANTVSFAQTVFTNATSN